MKRLIIIFLVCMGAVGCVSQSKTEDNGLEVPNEQTGDVLEVTDVPPEYPGGDIERQKFIAKHLNYPKKAIQKGKQGTVIIQFIVEKDGSVSNVVASKSFDEDCAKEAIRVASLMKWKPGEQRGKKVRVRITMPIKFRLK
ncbi:MAG: TonB family protein [Bacteroidota bacterium]